MNKRIIQGLLVVCVLAIWGIVIYRLVAKPGEEDLAIAPVQFKLPDSKKNDIAEKEALKLNYADPFLKNTAGPVQRMITAPSVLPKVKSDPKPIVPPVTEKWPDIIFKGIISNHTSGSQLAIISMNGNEKIIRSGEVIDGYNIMGLNTSYITVKSPSGMTKEFQRSLK